MTPPSAEQTASPVIEWRAVTVDYGRRRAGQPGARALDGVTLAVQPHDFLALVGPNGSGKSTAILAALGLVPASGGQARVFDTVLHAGHPRFRDIVYVPEEPIYHDYLTVSEAIAYYATLNGQRPSADALAATLDRLQLTSARHTRVSACSKGMKQKIGLAQCLLQRPTLLVLDEPMRGLDPLAVREVREVLVALHRAGTTVLMSSHVLPEVELLATRVAVLARGRLVSVSDLSELVAVDYGHYAVEVEHLASPPPSFVVESTAQGRLRGTVPHAELHALLDQVHMQGALLHACAPSRRTLEDSVMAALGASERHHG